MNRNFYSIRMHASLSEMHISGAERLVFGEKIDSTVSGLISRAMSKGIAPGRITVTIENLGTAAPRTLPALGIVMRDTDSPDDGRSLAAQILLDSGISARAIDQTMRLLSVGPAPSEQNMRGAMIIDALNGNRLEPDPARGVRASRLDWTDDGDEKIRKQLAMLGLSHFRTYEALALATKIAHGPGVMAELCWSDDPGYTAGYVASLKTGYIRFPVLKRMDDNRGGRAIFVKSDVNLPALVKYLQHEPVFINHLPDPS